MSRKITLALICAICVAGLAGGRYVAARAAPAASSAGEVLAEVNALRAQYGLEPYTLDGGLSALAQEQSDYMASIGHCTHERADGSSPADYGISAENVACGLNLSASGAIYAQWTDDTHFATMIGPDTGSAGAGVAVDGDMVFYTLAVKRGSGQFVARPRSTATALGGATITPGPSPTAGPTQPAIKKVATATALEDGAIWHVVQYGEAAASLAEAYGVSVDSILAINGLDPTKPVIYAGQTVLIRPANTLTPTPTVTNTPEPPTRTPTLTRTPRPTRTATVYQTPAPTATATRPPLVEFERDRKKIGWWLIGISVLGALGFAWSWVEHRRKERPDPPTAE